MENPNKDAVTAFINQIEVFAQQLNVDVKCYDSARNEQRLKAYLESIVAEARELIKYNEWLVALENALENLCEIDYKLKAEVLDLIKDILDRYFDGTYRLALIAALSADH